MLNLMIGQRMKAWQRVTISVALSLAFMLSLLSPAFAQTSTTGTINGTVTGANATKLAGVRIVAAAPSGRYTATTDANGFFSVSGIQPDTYSITFSTNGYQTFTLNGVTVSQNQSVDVSTSLVRQLSTIGGTTVRASGAFQPKATTDQITVNNQQIQTTLGKTGGTNEANLLASIPGASFDSSGYPVLRGGRENEEGFQFEGIDYTDAFTSQFINSLTLNGQSNFQVTPGAGDASQGNAGTGAINVIAKRGTYPQSGRIAADVFAPYFEHILQGEYGFATPNTRFSNYTSVTFDRHARSYGSKDSNALLIGRYFSRAYGFSNDVVNNMVYKFGRDNNQSLQFFYNNTELDTQNRYGVTRPLFYPNNDPYFLQNLAPVTGLTTAQYQAVQPFSYGQKSLTDTIGSDGSGRGPQNYNQPNDTFKLQYSVAPNDSTFLTAKYFAANAVVFFDFPYNNSFFDDFSLYQGGLRHGVSFDGTKQLNAKNLIGFGGKYEYLHPVYDQVSGSFGVFNIGGFGNGYEIGDFLSPNDPNCPNGPGGCGYLLGNNAGGINYAARNGLLQNAYNCGLAAPCTSVFAPYSTEAAGTNRQDFALYVKDTWTPTSKIKVDLGLRMDGANFRYNTCDIYTCLPTSIGVDAAGNRNPAADQFNYSSETRTPRVIEPRAAIAYQLSPRDGIHLTYGRSVTFAPLGELDLTGARSFYRPFDAIPSFDVNTGTTAQFCGTTFDLPCRNYGEQLYWENQNVTNGVPIAPLKPETFTNWEFGYTHAFPKNVSVRLTPFFRKAFNAFAQTASPLVKNGQVVLNPATGIPQLGPPVASNAGTSQITGVEFYLTKEAAYGLSGSLSMTYQNEFSNVIPGSASEDFFPTIPPASLALGNKYRVGFLSPFVATLAVQEKTRSGWRINPVLYYNNGYPIGAGRIAATTIGGRYYNVPNTNIVQPGGSTSATTYVDPRNPGSLFAPNIAATRGTPEKNSAGGVLSSQRIGPAQLTIEYSPPTSHSTVGVLIGNLFNQLYSQPQLNGRYQPVVTGSGGPYSGYSRLALNPAYNGFYNYTSRQGNQPYLLTPNAIPRNFDFYYQFNF